MCSKLLHGVLGRAALSRKFAPQELLSAVVNILSKCELEWGEPATVTSVPLPRFSLSTMPKGVKLSTAHKRILRRPTSYRP